MREYEMIIFCFVKTGTCEGIKCLAIIVEVGPDWKSSV